MSRGGGTGRGRSFRITRFAPDPARDVTDELEFYVEMRTRELEEAGHGPEEARRLALAAFGDMERIGSETRREASAGARRRRIGESVGWLHQDVRLSVRLLLRNPGFTIVAVLMLALGIGTTTAVFSVVDAVMLRPLPYANVDRVVRLHNQWDETPEAGLSPPEYFDYADHVDGLAAVGVYADGAASITGDGPPERLEAAYVTSSALRVLGVTPALGRTLLPSDDEPGGANVVLIDHGLWQRRYGGERSVIGKRIMVNASSAEIVGVLPRGFRLPDEFAAGGGHQLYLPLQLERTFENRGSHFLRAVALLEPGVGLEQASASLSQVASGFTREFPDDYPTDMRFGAFLVPVRDDIAGPVKRLLGILIAAVGCVLLIACANVANLLLARTEERRRELAVRSALGAGRGRLARQLLTESVVLAGVGGIAGIAVAWGAIRLIAWLRPPNLPRVEEVAMQPTVLLFAVTATLVTGLLAGLAPLLGERRDLYGTLRESGRGSAGTRRGLRLRRTLTAVEFALALVLVTGAGLLVRSFASLVSVDPGYRTSGAVAVPIALPYWRYEDSESRRRFFRVLLEGVRESGGVLAAGAVSRLPLEGSLGDLNVNIEGRTKREGEVSPRMNWQVVTPGYVRAMGMTLLRGRDIGPQDHANAPGAVLINEAAVRMHFPNEEPLGKRFTLGGKAGPGMVTVVGIVRDVRHESLAVPPTPEMYLPHEQFTFWNGGSAVAAMTLVVHARTPATLVPEIRRLVASADPDLPLGEIRTMEQVTGESVARPRFIMAVLGIFAVVALVLAAVGIYGLIAYTVSRRTAELGVRIALGARPGAVLGMVVRQGLGLVLVGLIVGLGASLVLTRSLSSLLYEVQPLDPIVFATATAALCAAALLACYIPARRVLRIQPVEALRG